MAKTRKEKEKILKELIEEFKNSPPFMFVDFFNLDSFSFFNFRNLLKEKQTKVKVIKKTLAKILMDKLNIALNPRDLEGSLALIWSEERDLLDFLKEVYRFSEKNENLKIVAGFYEGRVLNKEDLKELAMLPSKEELFSKVVLAVKAPVFGLVYDLKNFYQKLVFVLGNIKK